MAKISDEAKAHIREAVNIVKQDKLYRYVSQTAGGNPDPSKKPPEKKPPEPAEPPKTKPRWWDSYATEDEPPKTPPEGE